MRNFSTESVTAGHPDKVCDQISDALLDAALAADPYARAGIEVLATPGRITVAGETTHPDLDAASVARATLLRIGYDPDAYSVDNLLVAQSPDIARGVDTGGAGDQGLVFGYATDEPGWLPAPVILAHKLARALHEEAPRALGPDGKCLVATGPSGDIETVVASIQHPEDWPQSAVVPVVETLVSHLVDPSAVRLLINPTGRFVRGGPDADSGLTGRKIIVDTYGGAARHGGGAFSGKDPSKVDRSAAYAARQAALSLVANGLATRAEVQIGYAIGVAEPVSVQVETFGTGDQARCEAALRQIDLTPRGIIERLDLRRPIYARTAAYGHFTDPNYPWEQPLSL